MSDGDGLTVVVIAKRPVAGRVKTRLCPPFTPEQAADLAAASLTDTLDVVDRAAAGRRVLDFADEPGPWLRPGWAGQRQCDGPFDRRLADAFRLVTGPALVVGMDTPQLTPQLLTAFDPDRFDACLGPTEDGGYWTIGLADPAHAPDAITGVPMSTTHTYEAQQERLLSLGLRVQTLPSLVDVDTAHDAIAVAATIPGSAFATALHAIDLAGAA